MPKRFRDFGGFPIRDAIQTSPVDPDYNCIAWALHDVSQFWWPRPEEEYYWPVGFPRDGSRDTFVRVFESFGFRLCSLFDDFNPQAHELVAFFEKDGEVLHAARQLPDGKWTSKMGGLIDMSHDLNELMGAGFGGVGWVMVRDRPR